MAATKVYANMCHKPSLHTTVFRDLQRLTAFLLHNRPCNPTLMLTKWLPPAAVLQTRLTHLNFDSRGVTDACLPLLLPLGPCLRELDLSGGRITSRGAAVLAACFRGLQVLDLCGGHITGDFHRGRVGLCVVGGGC
jgi:hypothetical protein